MSSHELLQKGAWPGCIYDATYLETRMPKLSCRNVQSSSEPAFGYIFLRSAIGPAMVSGVWPCEHALVRPRSFAYFFSFVFLKSQVKTHQKKGGGNEIYPRP
jgi:hypothetical protein